jgi:hypothetical protein
MPPTLDIQIPDTWGRLRARSQNTTLTVDLHAEYAALRAALYGGASIAPSDDPYENEWDRVMDTAVLDDATAFVPFALFLRVDPNPDSDRKCEYARVTRMHRCS